MSKADFKCHGVGSLWRKQYDTQSGLGKLGMMIMTQTTLIVKECKDNNDRIGYYESNPFAENAEAWKLLD